MRESIYEKVLNEKVVEKERIYITPQFTLTRKSNIATNLYKKQESCSMSRKYSIKTLTRYKNQEICRRKYFAKTFTRDENHKNIEKHNDKPLKETRISKKKLRNEGE